MSSFAVSVASLSPSPSGSQSLNSSSTVNPSASSSSASSAAPVSSTDSSFFSTDGLLVIGITLSGLGLLLLLLFVWRWKAARRKGRGADAVVPRSTPVLVKRRVSSRTRNKRLSNRSKRSGLKNLKSASSSSKHSEQRRRHRSRSRSVNRAVVRAFSGSSAGTSISDCIPVPNQHPQYDSHVSGWVHPSSPQAPGRVVFDGQHNGTRFYQGSLVPGVMPVSAPPPLPGFTSPPINTMAMMVPSAVIPTPAALSHPTPDPVPPATQQAHRLRDRRLRMQISLSKAMRKSTLRKHRRRGMSHTPPLDALIALDDDDTVLPSDSISNVVVQVPLDAHRPASDSGNMPAPQVSRVGDAK